MTRRRTIAVTSLLAVLLHAVLLVGIVRWLLPSGDGAARSAQEAADRVVPGQVRVVDAHWRGEAGGYSVTAELVARPGRQFGWVADRRCAPGSACEQTLLAVVGDVRDGDAERAAAERAWRGCGVGPVQVRSIGHDATAVTAGPRVLASTVVVPLRPADLDGPGTARVTGLLDRCVLDWTAGRAGLLPVDRYTAAIWVSDPASGRVHSLADVVVDGARLSTPAGATLRPAMDDDAEAALGDALAGPVRAFLAPQGLAPARMVRAEPTYVPGTTARLAVRVTVAFTEPGQTPPRGYAPRETLRTVTLTADADGGRPAQLRLLP